MHTVNVYCVFLSVVCCVSMQNETVSYEKAQLWDASMRNVADIAFIQKLIDNQDINPWHLSSVQADFVVLPEKIIKVKDLFQTHNMSYSVVMKNVQRSADAQMEGNSLWNEKSLRQGGMVPSLHIGTSLTRAHPFSSFYLDCRRLLIVSNDAGHRLDWSTYPPLNIIDEYFNFLADDYASLCRLQVIGRTFEGRNIQMMNVTNGDPRNKIIVILAGLHGREWASITTALYILNTIVTEFDQHPDHIKAINWLVIPVLNPDGYNFTRSSNRFWRKNRHHFSYKCIGADINRNFGTNWNIIGVTENNKCKEGYAGPYPSSELETVAVRDLILNLPEKPSALIDIHTYGCQILYPWSAKDELTEDSHLHKKTASGMVKAIQSTTGNRYTHGDTYHMIYPATGSLLDWGYSQGIKHTYVIETGDKGRYGFLLPGKKIEETGREVFSAIDFLAKTIVPPNVNHRRQWF